MPKKSAFPFKIADRVTVPGAPRTQGFVSFPSCRSDGECGPIKTLRKGKEVDDAEGRIIFVAWIGEDGERKRGYFTEAALIKATGGEFLSDADAVALVART